VSESLQTLVQAARNNDETAWDQLFRRYQLPLYTYAKGLTGDREAAFDVVQETFARAIAHIAGLRDDSKFGSWLFGIAHQACVAFFRGRRREDSLFDAGEEAEGPDIDLADPRSALLSADDAYSLHCLIEQLPVAQRSALLLYILGDCSLVEIAQTSGVPVGTVKSRLFQAKRSLRELIEDQRP
jgi:RNA polymerase sigma-70 factor (ECF subfamily)